MIVHAIDFPRIQDARGNLTFLESEGDVPFAIQRVYYLYDVPGGASRGGHAHYSLEQVLFAVNGSFEVSVDDGFSRRSYTLNRAYQGLYLPCMTWRELQNFSSGAVCLVLASQHFDREDYIRDYDTFRRMVKAIAQPSNPASEPALLSWDRLPS